MARLWQILDLSSPAGFGKLYQFFTFLEVYKIEYCIPALFRTVYVGKIFI